MDNEIQHTWQKIALKILVPVLIVLAVGSVWFVKNGTNFNETITNPITADEINSTDFILEVTETLDIEALKAYDLPIIIDFGADSCIPCKEMAPVLKELNEELQGQAIIKFVDVWKYPELAENYPILVIPTQIFIDAEGNPYVPSDPDSSQMTLYTNRETNQHIFTAHQGGDD